MTAGPRWTSSSARRSPPTTRCSADAVERCQDAPACRRSRSRRRRASCSHLLARSIGARTVLEFGTLGGYSSIWLGRALPDGGRLIDARGRPRLRRGRAREHRPRPGSPSSVEHPRRPGARDPADARGGGRGAVRPRLHRRRQGQHARVLRLGPGAHPPRRPDRRRQRRPRRRPSPRRTRRPDDRRPAPPPRDARGRADRVEATTIQTVGGRATTASRSGWSSSRRPLLSFSVGPIGPVVPACPTPGAGGSPVVDTKPER